MERSDLDEESVLHLKRNLRDRLDHDEEEAETKEDKARAAVMANGTKCNSR